MLSLQRECLKNIIIDYTLNNLEATNINIVHTFFPFTVKGTNHFVPFAILLPSSVFKKSIVTFGRMFSNSL